MDARAIEHEANWRQISAQVLRRIAEATCPYTILGQSKSLARIIQDLVRWLFALSNTTEEDRRSTHKDRGQATNLNCRSEEPKEDTAI